MKTTVDLGFFFVEDNLFCQLCTGRETSPKELYALTALIAVPLFYFGGAGSAVFWIIGEHYVIVSMQKAGSVETCTVTYL